VSISGGVRVSTGADRRHFRGRVRPDDDANSGIGRLSLVHQPLMAVFYGSGIEQGPVDDDNRRCADGPNMWMDFCVKLMLELEASVDPAENHPDGSCSVVARALSGHGFRASGRALAEQPCYTSLVIRSALRRRASANQSQLAPGTSK
jgi:hypothetical protein